MAARLLRERRGACLAAGGETTVTLATPAWGGRNQELALQAALVLEGSPDVACMAFATDGIDGPTDAAGAVVTGTTTSEIRQHGLDPEGLLDSHNSYVALGSAGALLLTGRTGTNVADIFIGLKY
jgi:hydroxypyruvate reductase